MQSQLPSLVHPGHESWNIENRLGLDEVGAGADLLGQGEHVELHRIGERVGHGADIERNLPRDLVATHHPVLVPQGFDGLNQVDRINVVDPHGPGMVAQVLVVTSQAENIADAERGGSQKVALQSQPVAVAHHHLHQGLRTSFLDQETPGEARHAHHRGLVVGHVDRIARRLE